MSKDEILYVKGMNISDPDSEVDDGEEDIWDDRKLTDAYDKALRIANAEVAKRIAMSTNTQRKNDQPDNKKQKAKQARGKQDSSKNKKKESNIKWLAGMPCRACYEEDGCEYEAFVLTILSDNECVVRFLGYENSEIVPIDTLKPSLGKEERARQIEEALNDKSENGCTSPEPDQMELSNAGDEEIDPGHTNKSFNKLKNQKKKKNQGNKPMNGFDLPDIPMPNLSMLTNHGPNDMPLPPPPPLGFHTSNGTDSEDQAISSMLLSWYMSGYYTGLYQGLKRAREEKRNS
ncbi:survival motor neuron protein-like [Aphomia sociella]